MGDHKRGVGGVRGADTLPRGAGVHPPTLRTSHRPRRQDRLGRDQYHIWYHYHYQYHFYDIGLISDVIRYTMIIAVHCSDIKEDKRY